MKTNKTEKMSLAHIFSFITSNTEFTEQDLMQMSVIEIMDLKECVASSLRTKNELEQKIKKLKKGLTTP
jgi:hypothetical protein